MRRSVPLRLAPGALVALTLLLALWVMAPASATAQGPEDGHEGVPLPDGWLLYDGGALLEPEDFLGQSVPLELAIDLFAAGSPAVTWRTDQSPTVPFCTFQNNRPGWLSAERFRESVQKAVQVWSEAEAAVGVDYRGDCTVGSTWSQDNGINEIGWDDFRNVVRSPAAGVTFGRWSVTPLSRDFRETDIILDHLLDVPLQCVDSVVAHELGHALGFGHSTVQGDLMFPSFDPGNIGTCPARPTPSEVNLLQSLYGVNRTPTVTTSDETAAAGAHTTLSVSADDPDGDPLTYTWEQTGGPSVSFSGSGSAISFTAPTDTSATLAFEVTVSDVYLHSASASIVVDLINPDAPPSGFPALETLEVTESGRLALVWSEVEGATEYRFCTTPPGGVGSCVPATEPRGEVTWDTVLGAPVPNEPLRVFTSDTRAVTVQACNPEGCTEDENALIRAGGLQWLAHDVDYDYFGMAWDIPLINFRFTIAVVQNITGEPRTFRMYTGSAGDFQAESIKNCGRVPAGGVCIGFLTQNQRGHGTHVTIRSEATETPVLEHRIPIR